MYFTFFYLLIGWVLLGTFLGYRFSYLTNKRNVFKKNTYIVIGILSSIGAGLFGVLVNGMYSYQIIMKNNIFAFLVSLFILVAMTKAKKKKKSKKQFILRWKKLKFLTRFLYTINTYVKTRV